MTTDQHYVYLMEFVYNLLYAKALSWHYSSALKYDCYGCKTDHPSQHQHSWLHLLYEDHIEITLDILLQEVNEGDIHETWSECVNAFDIPPLLKGLQKCKFACEEWRATMKTNFWKEKLKTVLLSWLNVERLTL